MRLAQNSGHHAAACRKLTKMRNLKAIIAELNPP
jgi:hypothetical protein